MLLLLLLQVVLPLGLIAWPVASPGEPGQAHNQMAFVGQIGTRDDRPISTACLPMNSADYLQLVDATGRIVVNGKRGHIDPRLAPVLERLGFSRNGWTGAVLAFR
ncbi:MAG: hypothetical protein OEW73_09695 [Gammaproteobacteria bacterium]|nr:hypothetical protein [Gammaproteobacteria bacterium]MDH5241044.1 hypothetical protein [Gammaproteobacteria bacterium]MDH5262129.1 hypothetical protein [Gammaproteobacteria bacterium]MDH5502384.1 hypothetical protein [Gammaproteobacteria bacterium]